MIKQTDRERVVPARTKLIKLRPLVKERMMYGSDCSMIGRKVSHPIYADEVFKALGAGGLQLNQNE